MPRRKSEGERARMQSKPEGTRLRRTPCELSFLKQDLRAALVSRCLWFFLYGQFGHVCIAGATAKLRKPAHSSSSVALWATCLLYSFHLLRNLFCPVGLKGIHDWTYVLFSGVLKQLEDRIVETVKSSKGAQGCGIKWFLAHF